MVRAGAARGTVLARFLRVDLARIGGAGGEGTSGSAIEEWRAPSELAAASLTAFSESLDVLTDRDPAAGARYLDLVIREVHGPRGRRRCGTDGCRGGIRTAECRTDRGRRAFDARAHLAGSHSDIGPGDAAAGGVLAAYREWHDRSVAAAATAELVTPATEYTLDYRFLETPFRTLAPETIFCSIDRRRHCGRAGAVSTG